MAELARGEAAGASTPVNTVLNCNAVRNWEQGLAGNLKRLVFLKRKNIQM